MSHPHYHFYRFDSSSQFLMESNENSTFFCCYILLTQIITFCSFSPCRTKQQTLADSCLRSRYMYLPALTPTLISCHPFSYFLLFCEGKRELRQIRLQPQELPITAWKCVQQCCLKNAAFVNPAQSKVLCKPSFQLSFGNESSCAGQQMLKCQLHMVKRRGNI